jgi:hypothetical protein
VNRDQYLICHDTKTRVLHDTIYFENLCYYIYVPYERFIIKLCGTFWLGDCNPHKNKLSVKSLIKGFVQHFSLLKHHIDIQIPEQVR